MVVGSLSVETDVVVIGAGPGGYVAAIRAAQQGLDVIVVEKDKSLGGVCLNRGCIPTKALITSSDYYARLQELDHMGITTENVNVDLHKMAEWKDDIISTMENGIRGLFEKYGIEVIEGVGSFKDKNTLAISGQSDVETITFKHAIVATGSRPFEIPGITFDGEKIISSKDAIALKEVPKEMVIIGGGYIGTEMGTVYAKLGTKVHIFERSEHLVSVIDHEVVDVIAKKLSKFGVEVHTKTTAKGAHRTENGVMIEFEQNGEDKTLEVEKVLVVVGRVPNSENLGLEELGVEIDKCGFIKVDSQQKTSVENILAIGDLTGQPMIAHKASAEAKVAGEVVGGKNSHFDHKAIPLVVFNDPELVSVGLQENEAKEKGLNYKTKKFPYAALARAHMMDKSEGFIKVVADKDTDLVLGVQAAGPHASEIIGEATLAIEMGATVYDLTQTIHPHPTISEGLSEAADVVKGYAINIFQPPEDRE